METNTEQSGKATIAHARKVKCGLLNETEVARIAADPETRLDLLLVRCGCGRFFAPAQDVSHFIAIIEAHASFNQFELETDYVRDISLPATIEASK